MEIVYDFDKYFDSKYLYMNLSLNRNVINFLFD